MEMSEWVKVHAGHAGMNGMKPLRPLNEQKSVRYAKRTLCCRMSRSRVSFASTQETARGKRHSRMA